MPSDLLSSDITNKMPAYVIERVGDILKDKNVTLRNSKILIVGVTYKKNVKDLRKSPSLDMIDILRSKGSKATYYDPLIPYLKFNHTDLKSINFDKAVLAKFDCVIIATDHTCLDYDFILKNSKLIFDTRNAYKRINNRKVHRL